MPKPYQSPLWLPSGRARRPFRHWAHTLDDRLVCVLTILRVARDVSYSRPHTTRLLRAIVRDGTPPLTRAL